MFTANKSPSKGYSNTDANTSSEEEKRNNRIRTHKGIRRNNQPVNRSLTSFTGEVPSVGSVPGTASEQRIMKDQFKIFQDKVKPYVL